jgi:hypothetical protein
LAAVVELAIIVQAEPLQILEHLNHLASRPRVLDGDLQFLPRATQSRIAVGVLVKTARSV